jgi:hypothetical protein
VGEDQTAHLRARVAEAAAIGRDGRALDSLLLLDATLPALERMLGPDDPTVRAGAGNVDVCLSRLGRTWLTEISPPDGSVSGPADEVIAQMRWAWWLARTGQLERAEKLYLPLFHRASVFWQDHISTYRTYHNWLVVSASIDLCDRGRLESAIVAGRVHLQSIELAPFDDGEARRTRRALDWWERRHRDLRDGADPFALPRDAPTLGELLAPPEPLPPRPADRPWPVVPAVRAVEAPDPAPTSAPRQAADLDERMRIAHRSYAELACVSTRDQVAHLLTLLLAFRESTLAAPDAHCEELRRDIDRVRSGVLPEHPDDMPARDAARLLALMSAICGCPDRDHDPWLRAGERAVDA